MMIVALLLQQVIIIARRSGLKNSGVISRGCYVDVPIHTSRKVDHSTSLKIGVKQARAFIRYAMLSL